MSILTTPGLRPAPTAHAGLIAWVEQIAALTKPAKVHWCDGSEAEKEAITADLLAKGTLKALDQTKRPGCYYAASIPATSRAWRAAPSSARTTRLTPARPTTGPIRSRCAPV